MQKRRDLFQYIRSKKYNIACLQDVHIDNNMFSHVKAEWGYNLVLSAKPCINASRGVMILINNNFPCDIEQIFTDKEAIGENHIKLSENESESLEGDIKYSELAEALKNMKN